MTKSFELALAVLCGCACTNQLQPVDDTTESGSASGGWSASGASPKAATTAVRASSVGGNHATSLTIGGSRAESATSRPVISNGGTRSVVTDAAHPSSLGGSGSGVVSTHTANSGGVSGSIPIGGSVAGRSTAATGGSSPSTNDGGASPSSHEIVGYFAQWGIYQRAYRVKDVDTSGAAQRLTVINYAFGNVVNGKCHMVTQLGVGDAFADYQKGFTATESVNGIADSWDQKLKGNFNQLKELKKKYPKLKVLISLGGWTWSKGFSDAALTEASRSTLVSSCIDMYIRGDLPILDGEPAGGSGAAAGVFDGIDIDWEYPAAPGNDGNVFRPEDSANFTALLAEFRRQLDALDEKLLLTIAAPAGQDKIAKLELDRIHQYLDWINLMTYDMHGAWDRTGPTNFHSPLHASPNDPSTGIAKEYSVDAAVQAYRSAGVPANKLLIGIPFYGRGWTGVPDNNDGLYQSSPQMAPAPGTYEAGIEDYKVLKALDAPSHRDSVTQAYWTYGDSVFWSFDDPISIANKMAYVKSQGLRGAMAWELDGDTVDGELLGAITDGLR